MARIFRKAILKKWQMKSHKKTAFHEISGNSTICSASLLKHSEELEHNERASSYELQGCLLTSY